MLQFSAGSDARDVMWLDIDVDDVRYQRLYGTHRALVDKVASGKQDSWTITAWLAALPVVEPVATALLGGARPFDELQAVLALAAATTSEAALAERLRAGDVAQALAKVLYPGLQQLTKGGARTGTELHGKFAQDGKAFKMKYADLSVFFGGLESKIGPPDPNVHSAMEREHTASADSHEEFSTTNYAVTTTPAKEWQFVAEPNAHIVWPVEEKLRGVSPELMRRPMPMVEMKAALKEKNMSLQALNEPLLLLVEAFGMRLYTGPMCAAPQLCPAFAAPNAAAASLSVQSCCKVVLSQCIAMGSHCWSRRAGLSS